MNDKLKEISSEELLAELDKRKNKSSKKSNWNEFYFVIKSIYRILKTISIFLLIISWFKK